MSGETLDWLTDLMQSAGNSNVATEDLKIHDEAFVSKTLLSPHGRVGQGLLQSSWRMAKAGIDNSQCVLEQATGKIDISANTVQQEEQDIPKEVSRDHFGD